MTQDWHVNIGSMYVRVTDPPYCAAGDGIICDREVIQREIEDVYKAGGGTVALTAGRTFLSGGIILKSGVELFFEDGAVLYQSPDPDDYVKPAGDGYEPYRPSCGHNYSPEIKWSHWWYRNYPLIFAPEGSRDFAVRGRGTIRMMDADDPERIMRICPIGFFHCSRFEIADIRITNYHSYAMMPFTSDHGLIRNVRIDGSCYGNGDGICLMNCQDIRITGCAMTTGDDSVYIFSSCRDPRKSEWWSSDEPQPSLRIEVDHNDLRSDHCKAFGMILWGLNCEDLEKVEVRDVYVHDNHFETMGVWLYNPYTDRAGYPPVTGVRFDNNVIDGIEANFFETQISDMNHYRSTPYLLNGGFEQGRCFWAMTEGTGICREESGDGPFGWIDCGRERRAVWQGLFMESGRDYLFKAEVRSGGGECRLFVRNLDTGDAVALMPFDNGEWEEKMLLFRVPESGNYRVGLESTEMAFGRAAIRRAVFSGGLSSFGYDTVIFDRGKIIYKYNDDLFRR